eukprot:COSAG02_NODE_1600_length_11742_cov_33.722838_10_plen_103_part_00
MLTNAVARCPKSHQSKKKSYYFQLFFWKDVFILLEEATNEMGDMPAASDSSEPSAEEMRRVRLQRFGLATSGDDPAPSPRNDATLSNGEGDESASSPQNNVK